MTQYEYKVIYAQPSDTAVSSWASQKVKDKVARESMENRINEAADDGWEVISCSTAIYGTFVYFLPMATIVLRREKHREQVAV